METAKTPESQKGFWKPHFVINTTGEVVKCIVNGIEIPPAKILAKNPHIRITWEHDTLVIG